jgi:hypothetical protein
MQTNFVRSKSRSDYEITMAKWLKMVILDNDGIVYKDDGTPITHQEYVNFFFQSIEEIICDHQYVIKDKKKFKDEIYKYIYTLSDIGEHG